MVKCWHVSRIYKQKTWLISPEEARNPRKTRQLDTLINLLNVNHHPRERICVDTHFSPSVMQHLSHRSHTIPTSHFTDSWESWAGNETWDCAWSKCFSILEGEWCDKLSICNPWLFLFENPHVACPSQRGAENPQSFSQTDIWILLTFCVRKHEL